MSIKIIFIRKIFLKTLDIFLKCCIIILKIKIIIILKK
ncbi:hypothetical protein HMPREF1143_2205 [Peptoanaerobacter stomatis]|uniref:Uncharacterized protein n=1 Tax=Peptoanaerobacter stomatis TaxID=796937 RepID=J4WDL6_9FIRM|nr:hypothetical protein HMPREF1143_2205 [Peptoanaerobacter stomatis]